MCDVKAVDVLCVLCGHPLDHARILLCNHVCCRACMRLQIDLLRARCVAEGMDEKEIAEECADCCVVCEECGVETPLDSIRKDDGRAQRKLAELVAFLTEKKCCRQGCDKKAVWKCSECVEDGIGGVLCDEHRVVHDEAVDHTVEVLDDSVTDENLMDALFPKLTCEKHQGMALNFYCRTCNAHICGNCAVFAHRDHEYETAGPSRTDEKRITRLLRAQLKLRKMKSDSYNEFFDRQIRDVKAEYKRIHEQLEKEEQETIGDIERIREQNKELLELKSSCFVSFKKECARRNSKLELMRRCGCGAAKFHEYVKEMEAMYAEAIAFGKSLKSEPVQVDIQKLYDYDRASCVVRQNFKESPLSSSFNFSSIEPSPRCARAGFLNVDYGGAVFVPKRRVIIETSWMENFGMDVFVTHLSKDGHGESIRIPDAIPFHTKSAPVFDDGEYVYFQEEEGFHSRFGRLDVESLEFEELSPAPDDFTDFIASFHSNGFIYAFKKGGKGMRYDTVTDEWDDSSISSPTDGYGCRFLVHPSDDTKLIHVAHNGKVELLSIPDGKVLRRYTSQYVDYENLAEAVAVRTTGDEFFLFVTIGSLNHDWRIFSSEKDCWEQTAWPSTNGNTSSAVLDVETMSIFYHPNGQDRWSRIAF